MHIRLKLDHFCREGFAFYRMMLAFGRFNHLKVIHIDTLTLHITVRLKDDFCFRLLVLILTAILPEVIHRTAQPTGTTSWKDTVLVLLA